MAPERVPLMSVAEAAERWGVGEMTVRRMIHRREVRAARVGKQWRIPPAEVERIANPAPLPSNTTSAEPAQAAHVVDARGNGVATGTTGLGSGMRISRRPSWESETTDIAASRAAGGSRSARTRKRPSEAI